MRRPPILPLLCFSFLLTTASLGYGNEPVDVAKAQVEKETAWYDIRLLGVEGQGWRETKAPFDRLPAKAEGVVRAPVWSLSRDSAGLCVRFQTDSTQIRCRWKLNSADLAMPHMPATGVSGVDLYVKHEGRWRWLACGFPRSQNNEATLASGLPAGEREYLLYLPLYNGVQSVEIGLPKQNTLKQAAPRKHTKPIVFYGTSITQGGCASRPGMVHTALLGRWLDRPVINLGFSGNGRMEKELAKLLAEIDAEVYVIDCLPNIDAAAVAERTLPLIQTIRAKRPTTPIVLVEDRNYTNSFLIASKQKRNQTSQAALRKVYESIRERDPQISYLPGADLLGDDGEGTVDSSHPTDLGFYRQAQVFERHLRHVLAD